MARATIDQVAREAGVGRSTVSRVLNGSSAVSPAAREAVECAIERLNYVPSPAARSLVMKHAHAVGLIIPEELESFFTDPFFAVVMAGITSRVVESEYSLNVMVASGPPDGITARKVASFVLNGGVDGAIVVAHHVGDTFLREIVKAVPVVFGGRPEPYDSAAGAYFVDANNEQGGFLAGRHLIESGRTRLVTLTGPQTMGAAQDRHRGFMKALELSGLAPVKIIEGNYSPGFGARAARELLEEGVEFDGIFAANDLMAAGAMEVLLESGFRVPEDVAIIGFDDAAIATEVTPKLTTIHQPIRQLSIEMTDILFRVLAGEKPPSVTMLPTELVIRESA